MLEGNVVVELSKLELVGTIDEEVKVAEEGNGLLSDCEV